MLVSMQISVDGDTSTNDTVLGLANGLSGADRITDAASPEAQRLEAAVTALLQVTAENLITLTHPLHFKLIELIFHVSIALCSCSIHKAWSLVALCIPLLGPQDRRG